MKRRFRVVCTGYDLAQHEPSSGYLAKPHHKTREQAIAYAQHVAAEDVAFLVDKLKGSSYSIGLNFNEVDCDIVTVTYKDEKGTECVYSEYNVAEITECNNTHTNYMYRGFRFELNLNDKKYCIYNMNNYLINQAMNMRECCNIVDTLCSELLRMGGQ